MALLLGFITENRLVRKRTRRLYNSCTHHFPVTFDRYDTARQSQLVLRLFLLKFFLHVTVNGTPVFHDMLNFKVLTL